MAQVKVIEGKPAYTPKVASAHFQIPTVSLTLAYDDAPVAVLRALPKEFLQFEKHFWEHFAPKFTKRIEDMNHAVEEDVRKWEGQLMALPPDKQPGFAAVANKDLAEWINRWLRLVEGDCSDCCGLAYEDTMRALKKDVAHARFNAVAHAATTGTIKVAAAAVVPHVGTVKAIAMIIPLGKSLKATYDKFKTDWASLEVLTEAVAKDISATEIAMAKYLKAKSAGAGMMDKLKAFFAEVDAPAKKLQGNIDKMDKAIALTRASLVAQATAVGKMEEELKKAAAVPGGDAGAAKALTLIAHEKAVSATCAQVLTSAEVIKEKGEGVLKAVKESKQPDFAGLTKVVNQIKQATAVEKDVGRSVETLFEVLGEILKHHP